MKHWLSSALVEASRGNGGPYFWPCATDTKIKDAANNIKALPLLKFIFLRCAETHLTEFAPTPARSYLGNDLVHLNLRIRMAMVVYRNVILIQLGNQIGRIGVVSAGKLPEQLISVGRALCKHIDKRSAYDV